jgi:outer membrane lipoprotein-sorting protein
MSRLLPLGLVVAASVFARNASADPSAVEILKMADHAATSFKDLYLETRMEIFEPGASSGRVATLLTYTKGEKRLVRFTAPPDSKGMAMLLESRDSMYVYLPAFGKVRRMGTHAKNQSFMGSDVSNEDMAEQVYSGVYEPKLVGSEGDNWLLELTIAKGKEAEYPRLKMWVMKQAPNAVTRIDFFDEKGGNAKTQTRSGFTRDAGDGEHYTPSEITFVDHRRNDHRTVMHLSNAKVNQSLGDDLFSQRSLLRGQ